MLVIYVRAGRDYRLLFFATQPHENKSIVIHHHTSGRKIRKIRPILFIMAGSCGYFAVLKECRFSGVKVRPYAVSAGF